MRREKARSYDADNDGECGRRDDDKENRRQSRNLGFVVGGFVTIVNDIGGNVILSVKESRVAVSKEMAMKIMV